jgi:hypothetical protein
MCPQNFSIVERAEAETGIPPILQNCSLQSESTRTVGGGGDGQLAAPPNPTSEGTSPRWCGVSTGRKFGRITQKIQIKVVSDWNMLVCKIFLEVSKVAWKWANVFLKVFFILNFFKKKNDLSQKNL